MCIAPITVYVGKRGQKVPIESACHECWQCRANAINDWVGRNIAETKTSKACHAVTLTYGRDERGEVDNINAAVLTYSDVQKYLKLLRFNGYPVRYFVTGEFGSKKGRAHWHIMLYWQGKVPPHVLDKNFSEPHWKHGWSFWTKPGPHAVRYNCKYIQKDMGDAERQGHLAMSKKPPLGAVYFRQLAETYVQQGIAPQTLHYSFPDVRDRHEQPIQFLLGGRSAELFLDEYLAAWAWVHPTKEHPRSELLDLYREYGRIVSVDLVAAGVVEHPRDADQPSTREVLQPFKASLRQRAADEMSRLIDEMVLPSHLTIEGGHLEYFKPRVHDVSLEARWRYDTKVRQWRRLVWNKGKGWHLYGE